MVFYMTFPAAEFYYNKSLLNEGDVLLCRSNSLFGKLITWWTTKYPEDRGYNHCAMIVAVERNNVFVAEIYNRKGGRIVTLEEFIKDYKRGSIDVFKAMGVNKIVTVKTMLEIMFTRYSGITLLRNAVERFFKFKHTTDDNEPLNMKQGLTCATAIAHALQEGGKDPCPFLRIASVTPADLGRSTALTKICRMDKIDRD
jgi:hypothetical protein